MGPYELIAPIGAGGMGEVFRARDTPLDREVGIMVLPKDLATRRAGCGVSNRKLKPWRR